MTLTVALFGMFAATLGLLGVLSPERLLAAVTRAQSWLGVYGMAGLRLFLGTALLFAAPASRAPFYLTGLGGLAMLSGALTPILGVRRFEVILDWWRARSARAVRLWSAFVLGFGLSLVWAVFPPTPAV